MTNYDQRVDIFALGCIAVELFNIIPLATGVNEIDQIYKLAKVLGKPNFEGWPAALEQL